MSSRSLKVRFPWFIALAIVIGLVVPAFCVIWMMSGAIENERLAMRQRMAEIYMGQLEKDAQDWQLYWLNTLQGLERIFAENPLEDYVSIEANASNEGDELDSEKSNISLQGDLQKALHAQKLIQLVATNTHASAVHVSFNSQRFFPLKASVAIHKNQSELWVKARNLEFQTNDCNAAVHVYRHIQSEGLASQEIARALLAEARCETKLGNIGLALALLSKLVVTDNYKQSPSLSGDNLALSAALRALQLYVKFEPSPVKSKMNSGQHVTSINTLSKQQFIDTLGVMLSDYALIHIPSDQRLFVVSQLQQMSVQVAGLKQPLLMLEQGSLNFLTSIVSTDVGNKVAPYIVANFTINDKAAVVLDPVLPYSSSASPSSSETGAAVSRVNIYFSQADIVQIFQKYIDAKSLATYSLSISASLAKGDAQGEDLYRDAIILPLSGGFDGWQMHLHARGEGLALQKSRSNVQRYYWVAFLVIALMAGIAVLLGRFIYRQANLHRLKNDFIATVSHELKTPLASIQLLLETLVSSDEKFSGRSSDYLKLMIKENKRLGRLIDNLLTFSRMQHKRQVFHFQVLSPSMLFDNALEVVHEKLKSTGFIIDIDYADNLPKVNADPDMLVNALSNIIENAYKYSGGEKYIKLALYKQDDSIVFAITDKGIGLTRQQQKRVFERFYRVDQRLSRETEGCGLGLNIVQYIVQAHKGHVEVQSQLNHGSCFMISLPCVYV